MGVAIHRGQPAGNWPLVPVMVLSLAALEVKRKSSFRIVAHRWRRWKSRSGGPWVQTAPPRRPCGVGWAGVRTGSDEEGVFADDLRRELLLDIPVLGDHDAAQPVDIKDR